MNESDLNNYAVKFAYEKNYNKQWMYELCKRFDEMIKTNYIPAQLILLLICLIYFLNAMKPLR